MPFFSLVNWTNRTFIRLGLLVFCLLFGTSIWVLHIIKSGVEDDIRLQLQTVQNATHGAMHYWRDVNFEATIGVANRSIVKQHIARLITSAPDAASLRKNPALASLRKELQPFIEQHQYMGFFVVALNQINYGSMRDNNLGQQNLLLSKHPASLLQAFAGETVFSKPVLTDVPIKDQHGVLQADQYSMFVITPVTNQHNKIIALLMFRLSPVEHFAKILNIGRFGASGETYILNQEGLLISQSRFEIPLMQAGLIKPDSASAYQLTLREPGGDITRGFRPDAHYPSRPLTHVVQQIMQHQAYFDLEPARDYRGVKVLNIGLWDAHEGLGFITQIDHREAFAIYRTVRNAVFGVTGTAALLLAMLIASLLSSRQSALQLVKQRTQELKQQNLSLQAEIVDRKQMAHALQNHQHRTDAILQSAFDAIIATDRKGDIELVNPAGEAMFGYARGSLLGQNIRILMPGPISDRHDHLIAQHERGQVSTIVGQRREMVAKRKDGSTFPIELAVEETIIDGEKYFTSTIMDISQHKAMLERISESEREYKNIVDNLNDTFYRTDMEGRITMASPSAEQLLGYRQEELLGFKLSSLYVDPQGREKFLQALQKNQGSVSDYEAQMQRKDGLVIWVSTNAHFYTNEYGQLLGVEGTSSDITSRKLAEEEIRNSRLRLAFHIKQTPLGVIEWDVDFKVIEWNPAAEHIFGYTRTEAIGRHAADLIIPEVMRPHVDDIWHALLGNRGGQHSTNENITKQGGSIWCEWYNTPLVDENMHVIGVASMVMDVTASRQAQIILARDREQLQTLVEERTAELNIAKDEAERANESKSDFLANMSHELRTPIHTILSFAEIGMKKADKLGPEKIEQYFRNIHQGGERQLHLLNDLLDLAKLEAHTATYTFADHDIGKVVNEQLAQHELLLQKKHLKVRQEPAPPDTRLTFDRIRIEQVIRNLISNAIKFSEPGTTITIRLAIEKRQLEHDAVPAMIFSIRDQGVGIPEDELESIFDKFVQSSKTRTGAGGTGLGLAICQEIITAHGGEIWAENNEGGGASFCFTLPIVQTGETTAEFNSN